jgi:hypothetical protein
MPRATKKPNTGTELRNAIASLMTAAGFAVDVEVLVGGKVVDVLAQRRVPFGNDVIAIEAKDFAGTLPISETLEFVSQYGLLVRDQHATRAILVTRGNISTHGLTAINESANRVAHLKWEDLQREIFGPDPYLHKIVHETANSGIDSYHVAPKTIDGRDLKTIVLNWVAEDSPPPLAILGGYGTGKSTFAQTLARDLAQSYFASSAARIPILVPLGEISDENSLEGLFGKLFTSRYRIEGYHYDTFRELNRLGRLVIIFDGLDEMKHGMTIASFHRQCSKLLELHEGGARLILLGRQTVFATDREFQAIIKGKLTTATGEDIQIFGRPKSRDVKLRGFIDREAQYFVHHYFRWIATRQNRKPDWIEIRAKQLEDRRFREIVRRPIHAQMLCQIACNETTDITKLDEFSLYDRFVELLLHREILKEGRYDRFGIRHRRAFNRAISWWLLAKGGAAVTTVQDVPDIICQSAVLGVKHDFDSEGLKKELLAGCFTEKPSGTVYLGHQSIQDFLAAEYLFETACLTTVDWIENPVAEVCAGTTSEVSQFLLQFFVRKPDGIRRASESIRALATYRGDLFSGAFGPFALMYPISPIIQPEDSPWIFLLDYSVVRELS